MPYRPMARTENEVKFSSYMYSNEITDIYNDSSIFAHFDRIVESGRVIDVRHFPWRDGFATEFRKWFNSLFDIENK